MTSIVAPADSFVLVIGDKVSDLAQTISQQTKNVTVKQYSGTYWSKIYIANFTIL
jgi:hypothetical protein